MVVTDIEALKRDSYLCIAEWDKALEGLNEERRKQMKKYRDLRRIIQDTEKEIEAEKENEAKCTQLREKLRIQQELALVMSDVLSHISKCRKYYIEAIRKTRTQLKLIVKLWDNLK